VAILVAQIFIFNNIEFSGYINPLFYVLYIILLPAKMPAWARIISTFLLGFILDMFSQTPGLNASTSLLMGYIQPFVLYAFKTTDFDAKQNSSMSQLGLQWFLYYSGAIILIHHFLFFFLEVLRFTNFFDTILRILISSIATFITIIIAQLIIYKKQ
jgi:rod shape-determining protein MreD